MSLSRRRPTATSSRRRTSQGTSSPRHRYVTQARFSCVPVDNVLTPTSSHTQVASSPRPTAPVPVSALPCSPPFRPARSTSLPHRPLRSHISRPRLAPPKPRSRRPRAQWRVPHRLVRRYRASRLRCLPRLPTSSLGLTSSTRRTPRIRRTRLPSCRIVQKYWPYSFGPYEYSTTLT